MSEVLNLMQALITLNTSAQNVLLAELAYSKGSVEYEVVERMKVLFTKTVKAILENTNSSDRAEVAEIADKIQDAFRTKNSKL